MATMQDFLGNMAAPVRNRSAVRLALHNPNARSASDIADVERTARTLNMGYGLADAGGQDAALEARAREIEQNPIADAWTAKAEENIAFLNEDQQALADVYDSLVDSGILHEADADRETVINASGAGDDVSAAWQRGVIQNRIAGYGLQFQRGEYENLDELRAKILAAQKELESLRGDASDALGIYGAIEQLPRMIGYDAPYAGAGALAGGAIGSVVPGVGTLAGAGVGGLMGMAYTAANSEQGSFAADLLVQKDDAGNYLEPAAIQKAASLYGLFSGAVEVGGDALMLKLFKPVGGAIREAFSRTAARDALRNAAAHSSLWPALRSFAGGAGKAAAVEGTQEFVQEGLSTQIEASTRNLLSDTGLNYFREHQAGAFSREGLSRMLEAGWSAAKTGPWFYAVPGGVKLTLDTRSALRAQEFAKAHKELADKVAATKTRELSPARMESYLQTAGLDGEVLIPADAAWELQQKGTDLAGPLGWDVRDMEEAAALGHDLVMPAARLQALLPPEQMKAVADIMRESPNAKSALEAAKLNEDLPADLDGLIEQAEDDALERAAVEGEIARLRAEMTQAVTSSPHLVGQISSDTDPETGVARYVDSQLGLIAQRARVLTYMGIPMSDTLSRFSFRGQGKVEQGHTVTQEEADALAPFWDEVWGRIDADSLRVDFPDARRELAYRHGRGLFAKKGEGLSVDTLAGELKRRGLLEEDADASTLIERLKVMRRPDRRRLRERQKTVSVSLIQTPAENDMAYPDNDTPSVREGITRKPDSATANVVNVSGDIVPDFEGGRGKHKTRKLVEWLYSYFDAPVDVIIASTGQKVRIGKSGLEASVKKEKEPGHREAYGALKELVEKAEYDRFEPADERHKSRVLGQDVYYSALRLGEHLYSVQLKFDVPNAAEVESRKRVGENSIEDSRYKDHELREIEIAPAEVDGVFTRPSADAISEVSLGVLRGAVKPSRVDGGTLFQSAYHGTPTYYQFIGELGAKNLDRATEAATRLDNLAVAREMEDAGRDAEADASTLIERLKVMERPGWKAGTRQDSTLFTSIQDLQDPSIEWKQGFHNIPARPVVIPVTGISAKEAKKRAREAFSGKAFSLADGTEVRVSSNGIDETTSKRAASENSELLAVLPDLLANTYIYRTENGTDTAAQAMHGVAAATIDGRPVLVRSVFKYISQGKAGFWKYYGSKIMELDTTKGAPASWITKDSLRESETPFLNAPLSSNLYDWILAVKDPGKRFPADRTSLFQSALQKKVPAAEPGTTASQGSPDPRTTGNHSYTLRELLEDVNDNGGKPYLQTEEETIAATQQRIREWLSPENLAQAQGKTREEIFAMFGNELEPVAVLPSQYLRYFRQAGNDNRIYSGKGYFIDHAVNHHPEVPVERYQDIQGILNSPDEVLLDRRTANDKVRDGLIFVKELDANYAVAVSMEEGNDGKIVMHKTFFKTKKNPFKKLERVSTSVGGVSTISHTVETVPGSSLSARDVAINIPPAAQNVKSSVNQDNSSIPASATAEGMAAQEDINDAEAKLQREVEAWEKTVDALTEKPSDPVLMLRQTPLIFHLLGAEFREVYAAPHVFDGMFPGEAREGHNVHPNINADILKQLPAALADPIAVFGSSTVSGRLVFMVDVKDANGATVVMPVQLDAQKDFASIHIVTSAYSKEQGGVPNNIWFEKQAKNNLLYVNRYKKGRWNTSSGSNSLWVLPNSLSGKRIYTEADLVKLRLQYPGYYHSTPSSSVSVPQKQEEGRLTAEEVKNAEARLREDIAAWEKTVDDIIAAGKVPSSPVQMLTQTPLVMSLLGKDTLTGRAASTGGIYASSHFFDDTHPNITWEMRKQIPAAMADPIAVFDSASPEGRARGDIVFMLELTDANGATVVVPVALEGKGDVPGVTVNIAKSVYTKESNGIPSNGWFAGQAKKNARYINRKKMKSWQASAGVYFPFTLLNNSSNNIIYTEADLVKLREQFPGHYHGRGVPLGAITPNSSGHYLIRLFHGANLSTLTHETAHVFFLEMERLEREGLADEKMLADLAALREWTAAMDDDAELKAEYDRYQKHAVYGGTEFDALPDYLKEDARSRAKQEMLARGFEQYLREGKAPSRRLESLFRRFRKWLLRVYRDALNLHVELTDDVRDVFDRMLTHEEDMKLRPEADSSLMKGLKKKQAHSEYYQLTDENSRKLRQKFDNSPTAIMRGNEIFNADHPFPEKMADRRNAVIAWLEKKGWLSKFENKDTGWEIAVSRGSIRDTSSHGMNEGKAQVLAALPELITNAIYVGEGVPKKVGHKRYIFAAKAQVAKKAYVVGLVVDEDHNGKRFYNHELTEIEDLDGPSLDRLPEGGITEANQGLSVLNLIRKKLGVNIDMFLQSAHHGAPLVSEGITRSISGQNGGLKNAIVSPGPDGNTHHQPGIGGGTLFQGISADVRDVFDRMLAHEEEMELRAEAAEVREETARLLDMLALKGARRQEMEGLITAAKDDAAEKLRHARDAERLKQRRTWTREAREQMEREQVYIARRAMRRTPIDLAGFNEVNGEELGRELVRKLPGAATRRKDGVEAEVLAAEQGYESAAAMARDIISSPTPGERVRQLVEQRQAEHDALFDAGEYLFGQEQLAEQQERLAEALEAKMRHIPAERRYLREERGSGAGGEETALTPDARAGYGATALRHVGRDQLRAQALAVLDRKPMGEEVLPEAFRRAAGRWMREERRAVLRGDFGKALQANYRARINIELARQSAERRRMLRELERKAQEFLETDRADSDARFAVLVLSQNIGLFNPTHKMLADAGGRGWKNVEAFASRMREEGFMGTEDAFDRELFTTSRAWKGMNRSEFRPYAETMTMIMHMEKESRTAYTAQGRMDLEKRAKEVADSIQGKNRRRKAGTAAKRDSSLELLKKFRAEDLKAEAVAALLEGNAMGQALKAVTRPVLDATRTQAERLKRERDTLKTLFSVYSRQELADMQGKRFTVPGLPDAMTKEQELAVLLNCGNAGNRQRLMAGQNFTEEQIRAIIDTLDERDVRFAQSVWKYLETFGKECFELEEKLTGVRPEAVSARPVQTRFGLLRGGYYPLVCDRESSLAAADADSSGTQGGALFPSVDSGAVKRGRREAAGPLFLSLDVIPRHVAETVHLLVFRRPVIEAAKILHRREVNEAIRETAGAATAEALDAWLRHVAGQRPARNGWSRAASWARKNAALHAMGLRLSTMLAQTTGLLSAVGKIGPHWTLRGVVDSYGQGRPWDVYRTVRELSPMMRNRMASIEHEASAVSSRFAETGSSGQGADPFMRMKSFMEAHGLVPMGLVHLFFAELPAWNGAYAGALKENGGNVAEAVLYADAVVARMQGSSGGKREASAVRRGQTPARIMSMFYACFSALYTLSARRIAMHDGRRDAASVYRLATLALLTWFAEPVLMGLLKGGPKSRNAEDMPDAEDWFSWGAKDAFFNPFSMIIDVQEASSMTDSVNSGKVGRTRLTSAPALPDLFDSAMRFGERVGKAVEGEGDEQKLAQHGEKPVEQVDFINEQDFLLLERFRDWLAGTSPELELGELIRKKKQAGGDAPGGTMDRVKRAE